MEFKKFIKAAAFGSLIVSGAAHAGPNPYTECGIGAAIFNNEAVIDDVPLAALISNVIWDLGTTAVTSATATPETCTKGSVETAMFINDTYNTLVEETARGEGEHLSAMLSMAGCTAAEQPAAAAAIRTGMSDVITAEGYAAGSQLDKASSYYDVMQGSVSANCVNTGV